jgi:hypothetical protein
MSASTLIVPPQALVVARSLRDIVARTNSNALAAYKAAHVGAHERTLHEFMIDGILGDALAAEPQATVSFLNLACDSCERVASFGIDGRRIVLVENGPNTESDEMLLARSDKFITLMRNGFFDGSISNAATLASDPAFDVLIVSG